MISTLSRGPIWSGFHVIDPLVRRLRGALDAIGKEPCNEIPEPAADTAYSRVVLVDTPELLVIAARWRAGAEGDLHGHSKSAGLYRIVSGAIEEQRYLPEGSHFQFQRETLRAQRESFLPTGSFHQLRAMSEAISIHAYAPRPDEASSSPTDNELAKLEAARAVALYRG
jgi:hypothetical protein